jgi:hypothetical protein
MIDKSLPPSVLRVTPQRRRVRCTPHMVFAPRRSAWLAKKAVDQTPTVATTQNVLMKKLGVMQETHVSTEDFDRYLKLFEDGLRVYQARAIGELIMAHVPGPEEVADAAGEAPLVC